ncbi:DUF4013 domain-containing protein [Halosegnis sp.]|uniref:DUF4013 domain-containing protein n=1 Tax=Halosegnis sp. TaxID=2864959 RepID=UPI0035D4B554
MLGRALRFPLAGDDGLRSVVLGGICSFLGVLILPTVLVLGYYLRAGAAGAAGDDEAPPFDDWTGLFVDGLKSLLVLIGYLLVPLAVFGAAIVVGGPGPPSAPVAGINVLGAAVGGWGTILLVIAMYLLPAGLISLARTNSIRAAFDIATIGRAALSADYFVAGLLAILLTLLVGVLTVVLTALTFGLFSLLSGFVQFYTQVAFFYLFGLGYGRALGGDMPGAPKDRA